MSKNDYVHVPKWYLLRQIAWNKSVTDWLAIVLPRTPDGEIAPSLDAPDCQKYYTGKKLTEYAEDALVWAAKGKERRGDEEQIVFDDKRS